MINSKNNDIKEIAYVRLMHVICSIEIGFHMLKELRSKMNWSEMIEFERDIRHLMRNAKHIINDFLLFDDDGSIVSYRDMAIERYKLLQKQLDDCKKYRENTFARQTNGRMERRKKKKTKVVETVS